MLKTNIKISCQRWRGLGLQSNFQKVNKVIAGLKLKIIIQRKFRHEQVSPRFYDLLIIRWKDITF